MTLDPQSWPRVRALFDAAMEQPAAGREAWLQAQTEDAGLQQAVRELLLQATDAGAVPWPEAPAWPADESDPLIGQTLGAWVLTRRLGQGGMGVVYAARRGDGRFEGQAAVKLLRSGLDGSAVLARFAQEQQSLARLHHPHIAHLLDAGVDAQQRPFFVMELVEGRPLDEAVAGLALEPRLGLMLQLCEAVSHAHRNLLVHRDLKPGNVLVDAEGQVKLLDFGIAKALDPLAAGDASQTVLEQRPFTPAYASPEQVRGEPVSTATDLYSLGVLLYLLLTGLKPYGREATTPAEAARAVLEEAPVAPSLAAPADLPWRRRLQGDLDRVLLKALAKDPAERYSSVEALAADLRAWLAGYPVSAQPPSRAYLLRRWWGRHRLGASLAGLGLLAVVASAGVALWQAHEARLAQQASLQRLAHIKRMSRAVLYRFGDAVTYLPGGLEVKTKMLDAMNQDLEQLAKEAGADPDVQVELAQSYARLAEMQTENFAVSTNEVDAAERNARAALQWFERAAAQAPNAAFYVGWGTAWDSLAKVQRSHGKPLEALDSEGRRESLLKRALQRWTDEPELLHALASAQMIKGQLYSNLDGVASAQAPEQARQALAEAIRTFERLVQVQPEDAANHHQLGVARGALAIVLGSSDEAVAQAAAGLRDLQRSAELEPDNLAHLAAWQGEANNQCARRQDQSLTPDDEADCSLSWALMHRLLQREPEAKRWQDRVAGGSLFSGISVARQGRPSEAAAMFQEGVRLLAADPKPTARRLKRLAATRLELASQLGAAGREPWRLATEYLRAQADGDADIWLLRARALEVQAQLQGHKKPSPAEARQIDEAYGRAQAIRPLTPAAAARRAQLARG